MPATVVLVTVVAGGAWVIRSSASAEEPNRLTLYGNVDIRQVLLAFNACERVAEARVREGDAVQPGQVLGCSTPARRGFGWRRPRPRSAPGSRGCCGSSAAAGRRKSQAPANVAAAEGAVELAARQLARLQAASEATAGKGASALDLDDAHVRFQVATAPADGAHQAAQLAAAGPRQEVVAQIRQQLAAGRAEAAPIQRQIDESALRAPIAAVVRARLLEPGDMASPQRPVCTLAITAPNWVRAYVPEAQLRRIRTGMAAEVSTDSQPDRRITAKLDYIASVAEFTPKTVQTPELRTSQVYDARFAVEVATLQENWLGLQAEFESITGDSAA